ncbi:MAG: DUF4255 domain-containing protein [Flavobacteriales bacterium]|jgi:hypothetical protein|nr:DUF4255 domain-containing protein [Flavobacteriales bacterium]MBT7687085.1 DUF4255 domain-containing protein [Flavobacteriales bacterium]MBT7749441.1 DUF4255 domain-containing protein [Flavobacteriales bacterium]NCG29644.1 DUF4255 domain-containing protein [Bacteroidota bacterium]
MIHNLFPTVGAELNEYFKSKFDLEEDRVIVSNLVNQDGSIAVEGNNKVVFHLVNIEEETTLKATSGSASFGGGFGSVGGDINVNLTVMFSAYFTGKNYVEALKFLSGLIYFFQGKPVFTQSNSPGLSSNIDKAVFDIISMEPRDLNSIFSMMGAKYMPSVIYRIRMLTFSSDNIDDTIPAITGIGINEDNTLKEPLGKTLKSGTKLFDKLNPDKT